MEIELKYGEGTKEIAIPESADVVILEPNPVQPVDSVEQALKDAFSRIDEAATDLLPELQHNGTVAIAIPDETRPLPVVTVLPLILDWLFDKIPDLQPERVTVVVGGGLHPPVDQETLERLVPPSIVKGCRVLAHDAINSPMVDYGTTDRGTPVQVNEAYAIADYKIVIGQIDPHQFVGFTGGSKGVVIGCGGEATIEHNHSLMFHDDARVGLLDRNPVREDLNEAGEKVGIDLSVNFVMAPNKDIVQVLVGKPMDTLRDGARTCADLYGVGIDEKFDIVVASCGGYPKDICLYQAQKGLNLASQAVEAGGNILLLAASPQGVGDDVYFDYVSQFTTPEEVLADFKKQGFRMGAHKAYLFGRTLSRFDVAVYSDLDPGVLKKCHLRSADPSEVIKEWFENFEGQPKIGIIPNANTTYFYQRDKQ
ncbi:MAG: nickel-dependent lactate racemase [Desulfobulbaceae bacterium]|nr:MAG: nickel-dependent lactate racemase [Desulfobulbaceae bacterium]